MDNSNECRLTDSMWWFVSALLKVQPVLQKFLFPLEDSPDRWWGHVKPFPCSPPSSTPPAQHITSAAAAVQSVSSTVIDAAQSLRDQDLSSAVSPSTHRWGELNRTSVRKSLQGEKGPCAAHLPDKRFNQPALHPPHPLLALGTSWSQPPQLPGANIPLRRCDGPSLRDRAMIELELILINTHLRHMQPFGAWVKSISRPCHIYGMRGYWSRGLRRDIHTIFSQY